MKKKENKFISFILKPIKKDMDTLSSLFKENKEMTEEQLKIKESRQGMWKEFKEWFSIKNFFASLWEYKTWFIIMFAAFLAGMHFGSVIQFNQCVDHIEENYDPLIRTGFWEKQQIASNFSYNSSINVTHDATNCDFYKPTTQSPPSPE